MLNNTLMEFTTHLERMGFGLIQFDCHDDGILQFRGIDISRADKVTLRINTSNMRVLVSYSSWNGRQYLDPSFVCVGFIKSDSLRDLDEMGRIVEN